jgi:hypothetical protein
MLQGCAGPSTSQCFMCSVTVWRDTGSGGTIYSDILFGSESDVYSVARKYCSERGQGSPNVGPRMDVKSNSSNWEYSFSCASKELPVVRQPVKTRNLETDLQIPPQVEKTNSQTVQIQDVNKSISNENMNKLSLEAAKKKCTELGFKPKTEGYGRCVLQLSK